MMARWPLAPPPRVAYIERPLEYYFFLEQLEAGVGRFADEGGELRVREGQRWAVGCGHREEEMVGAVRLDNAGRTSNKVASLRKSIKSVNIKTVTYVNYEFTD